MRVALYVRVSHEEQVKYGVSLETQENELKTYCNKNNYEIFKVYRDEGISASSIDNRKGLLHLLDNLVYFDMILFTKLDRLSRNVLDANTLLKTFDEHNVSFKAILEDDVDTSTADGRFLFNLKVNLAEREKNKVSERIKDVFNYKRKVQKTVCSGRCPYGYKIVDKKIVIDEEKSNNIKKLYEHYIQTQCFGETVRWYQDNIEHISSDSIRKYLSNTCYYGEYKLSNGEIIKDYCPPIITKEIFDKAQSCRKMSIPFSANAKQNREFIFSGLLVCGKCSHKMNGKYNKKGNSIYNYYVCKKKFEFCKNSIYIGEKWLENYLLENIKKELENTRLKSIEYNLSNNDKKPLKTDKNAIKKKINKLTELYLDDMIDRTYYNKEYNRLNNELLKLDSKPNEENFDSIKSILDYNLSELYITFNNTEKRLFWSGIIDSIVVNSKNDLSINFRKE